MPATVAGGTPGSSSPRMSGSYPWEVSSNRRGTTPSSKIRWSP